MGEFFVPSRACSSSDSHQVYEFKKTNTINSKLSEVSKENENIEELCFKKARFEVYKFAQSGLSNTERKKSQMELAIKLGAVPRKNKAINYKELKERNQAKKKEEINRMTVLEKNIKPKKRNINKSSNGKLNKKRKVGSGILKSYGKVAKRS